MKFAALVTLALASIGFSYATAAAIDDAYIPVNADAFVADSATGIVKLTDSSGCGSTGPLGDGHYEWYIVVSCNPGDVYFCQAEDASGCEPGVTKKIGSLEVDDPDDIVQYAKQTFVNSLQFVCPSGGQIRCQANFEDNNDGPNYSLRVVS